jgi:hypothetical protein
MSHFSSRHLNEAMLTRALSILRAKKAEQRGIPPDAAIVPPLSSLLTGGALVATVLADLERMVSRDARPALRAIRSGAEQATAMREIVIFPQHPQRDDLP